jgi:filamentous hemagglutinin
VNIQAIGAGQDSNLTIRGSVIEAGRAVQLLADNEVKLLAAQNTASQNSTNSSSSASVGIGAATGGTAGAISGLTATVNNYLTHTELKTQKEMKDLCKAGNSTACEADKLYDRLSQIRQETGNTGCFQCKPPIP